MLNHLKNNKLGTIALFLCLSFILLGLPAQIWKIWQSQSAAGISLLTFALLTIQSFFWVLYGWQKKDWFIIIPNTLGTILAGVIVAEYFWLR